jgi:hypothetical protein
MMTPFFYLQKQYFNLNQLFRKLGMLLLCLFFLSACKTQKEIYLFSSFHEPANEGLRLAYSYDAYHWKDLGRTFLKPEVGAQKIMRDPSITQGPDGTFRFVWTSAWKGEKGFAYASSKDLIHWSAQKYIPVMEQEPTVVNVWAPEIFYDDENKQFIIVWASTIPNRFARGVEDEDNNHRLYYTTTKDFNAFSPAKLFFDPSFSSIDAEIVKRGTKDYVLVFKDNTRPERDVKVAFATNPLGPYTNVSKALTPGYSEGPTVAHKGNDWLIYFDWYNKKIFGAIKTTDFKTFTDITNQVDLPAAHKHGTIFKVKKSILKKLMKVSPKK